MSPEAEAHERSVEREFTRTAALFAERTRGRFDDMDVVAFSRARTGMTVAEVGAGTGNFLALFDGIAARSLAVDLTPAMLYQARARHPGWLLVVANGNALPLGTGSIDLVTSAQALHHIPEPLPFLQEMRRVCSAEGRILVVDQVAPERFEEAVAMSELETVRDPTHAVSRPPSAFRILLNSAGLKIVDERITSKRQRFRDWMWPAEFSAARIETVREFIERRGEQTGMAWQHEGDDFTFERRRIMLLAVPA